MSSPSYLLIDGRQPEDTDLTPIFNQLYDTLVANSVKVKTLTLRDLKLGHCVGCFGCWLKTPGQCVQPDAGREIVRSMLQSDVVILFGRIVFGTYSPEVKRLVDRCLSPLNLPYLQVSHGETHHQPRYKHYPRLISVGVQNKPDVDEAALFKLIVGRNALQTHAPSYAASAVSVSDSLETLRNEFQELLSRVNPLPRLNILKSGVQDLDSVAPKMKPLPPRPQALLITGSPKAKPSTSAALGGYLLHQLETYQWRTATLKLHPRLRDAEHQNKLLEAVDRSDLIVLSFPLYNDSLPHHVIYAIQLIASHRSAPSHRKSQRLVVIANNGFPEPHHNLLSIEVCRRFAGECGLDWAGGFAVGGGEALSAGQLLPEIKRTLPPVKHLMQALDLAAVKLSNGQAVPQEAARLISRNPIYPAPFSSYRWIFQRVAARRWEREAAKNGLSPARLLAQPYSYFNG